MGTTQLVSQVARHIDIGQNALAWRELPIDAASTQSMKKSNMKKQRTAEHGMTTLTDAPTEPSQCLVCTLVPFLLLRRPIH